jgi:flagellar protein FlaG
MAGDFAAITAALTRTPTPDSRGRPAAGAGLPGGNLAAPSGETLPVSSPPPPPPPPVVDVERAVERLNQLMTSHQCSLRFEIDASSGRTVITVINDATKEVIRQIPSPELLQIARNLDDLGSLVDARV